jgi:superfamily II DNA or RNA helicase
LLVVPTLELLDQTLRRLRATAPDLEIGVVSGTEERVCLATAITYASMMKMIAAGELTPDDVDCVVLDEAHRALSDLRQELLTPFLSRAVFTAFTASPKFDSEKNIHSFLGAENEVYRATDRRLRDEGIIAPVVNYILKVEIKGTRPTDPDIFSRFIDATSARVFKEFLRDHADPKIGQRLKDRLIFGFARSISHARHTAELLNAAPELGIAPSESVSGRDRREDITEAIRRFGDGQISVLMNKWLLTEGIDVPASGGVVSLAPTTSLVAQLQRGGRCRRRNYALAPDDARQIGMVVDFSYTLNGKPLHPNQVFYCQAAGGRDRKRRGGGRRVRERRGGRGGQGGRHRPR